MSIIDYLLGLGFSKEVIVFVASALPVTELRFTIPLAINVFHLQWYYAFLLAVVGNLVPVPLILLFLNGTVRLLSRIGFFEKTLQWLFRRTRRRGSIIEKYERIGLILFVAIPLPVTGAWTGSLAAVLFELKFKHAFLSIFAGIVIAGIIVTCVTLLGWTIFGLWKA